MSITTNPKRRSAKRKLFKAKAEQAFAQDDLDEALRYVKLFSMHINAVGPAHASKIEQQQWASIFMSKINAAKTNRQYAIFARNCQCLTDMFA